MAERSLRLLCLDGGGVRGLASLYVLKRLLSYIGDPKPCDYFDMICGTSTGGLIAIMLGRLQMTVQACIEAFVNMIDIIFERQHALPFKFVNGKIQPRYDSAALESCIKRVIRDAGFSSDAPMRGPKESTCKVFVVALDADSMIPVHFTDYYKPGESTMFDEVKIWEAACATSAATTFFKPAKIMSGGVPRTFVDGALNANNPVNRLWIEAEAQFPGVPLETQIRCLLSIGTGRPSLIQFGDTVSGLLNSIKKIATETQRTADTFHDMHRTLADRDGYFRFNPPYIDEVGLHEAGKRAIVEARTAAYTEDPEVKRAMERFRQAVGEEQKAFKPVSALIIPTKLFYVLDQRPQYIKPNVAYWQHLTLDSYDIYEKIYNECKSPNGMVHFLSFLQQFNLSRPAPRLIEKIWARTLRDQSNIRTSSQNKHLTMATLYMLHIETAVTTFEPPKVDMDQRELLKRFAKWVPCRCKKNCGREWNFITGTGLSRGGSAEQKCGVIKYLQSGSIGNLFSGKDREALLLMREDWMSSTLSG